MAGVTLDDVRDIVDDLDRAYEVVVGGRVKFRVGRLVFLAFDPAEALMGFAFPRDERDALVASAPDRFQLPRTADLRYHWVVARLAALDLDELRELVVDAWSMVVPRRVSHAYLRSIGVDPDGGP